MSEERKGELAAGGAPLTLIGKKVNVGDQAPDFKVRGQFGPESEVTLASSKGKVRLISVVPSLDTGVCEQQTVRFNKEADSLGDNVEVLTVSMDLPTAQGRFCGAHAVKSVKTLSDYAEKSFGRNYGILIKEWQVLGRGIFVVDKEDTVRYVEYVPEVGQHPDYEKALEAVKSLR